jgi:ATP-dependent Lon protease
MLGPRKYFFEMAEVADRIGIATALAWTQTGGEIIFIEATKMKGRGRLLLTGSLGDVMKESAQAALSYIRSHTDPWGIPESFFETHDIHVHVPAGAIPKDGPSAGLTIAVALLSVLTERPAKREIAFSGELTLSGRILPVGGIKDKALAAHRAGVKCVVFPSRNEADLAEIPDEIKGVLEILTVKRLEDIADKVLKGR